MLSSSSSSQGVILELEGEHAEENETNDLGKNCLLMPTVVFVVFIVMGLTT